MIGIKHIEDVVRTKQLEILKVVEDALQQREVELRQLQRNLLESLRVVNRLLETDDSAIEIAEASAANARGPVAVITNK